MFVTNQTKQILTFSGMVMQSRKYILLLALVMLCFGGVIYLFFRDEVIFTSWLYDSFSINPPKFHNAINTDTVFGYIFLYSLADALWYGSLLLVESQLRSNTWYSKAVTVATMALPFAFEFLQLGGIMPGTFDWVDVLIYLLTLITFILCRRNFCCKY